MPYNKTLEKMPVRVAKRVIKAVGSGKKVNLTQIQKDVGYSLQSAHSHKALQTKAYKDTIKPVLRQYEQLEQQVIKELIKRGNDLTEEQYRTLVDSADKYRKNVQLLSGKSTENIATQNNIVVYGGSDFMAKQLGFSEDSNK